MCSEQQEMEKREKICKQTADSAYLLPAPPVFLALKNGDS
jgi:hypothetical protein